MILRRYSCKLISRWRQVSMMEMMIPNWGPAFFKMWENNGTGEIMKM